MRPTVLIMLASEGSVHHSREGMVGQPSASGNGRSLYDGPESGEIRRNQSEALGPRTASPGHPASAKQISSRSLPKQHQRLVSRSSKPEPHRTFQSVNSACLVYLVLTAASAQK